MNKYEELFRRDAYLAELGKLWEPIRDELIKLEPGNDQHPTIKQFSNWLLDPKHTGEDFAYFINDLSCAGCTDTGLRMYLCKVAIEAFAQRCPVLECQWKYAAQKLLQLGQSRLKHKINNGFTSDILSAWIIHVIDTPDTSYPTYLRLQIVTMLCRLVDLTDCIRTQVLDQALSTCSSYVQGMFEVLARDGFLLEFDKKLVANLSDVKSSRCSAIVHDVGYIYANNYTSFTEPRAFYGLIDMFKNINKNILKIYHEMQTRNYNYSKVALNSDLLYISLTNFPLSCQVPQLYDIIQKCKHCFCKIRDNFNSNCMNKNLLNLL